MIQVFVKNRLKQINILRTKNSNQTEIQTDQYSNRVIPFMKKIIESCPWFGFMLEKGEDL